MLLAVDPGADAGWAVFGAGGDLTACGLTVGMPTAGVTRVVIERPMIYPGRKQKARPADVVKLATRAGERVGLVRAFSPAAVADYVEPFRWKGDLDKDTCHRRAWGRLKAEEQAIVSAACRPIARGKRHNVMDAIAIGLWAVGRAANSL